MSINGSRTDEKKGSCVWGQLSNDQKEIRNVKNSQFVNRDLVRTDVSFRSFQSAASRTQLRSPLVRYVRVCWFHLISNLLIWRLILTPDFNCTKRFTSQIEQFAYRQRVRFQIQKSDLSRFFGHGHRITISASSTN